MQQKQKLSLTYQKYFRPLETQLVYHSSGQNLVESCRPQVSCTSGRQVLMKKFSLRHISFIHVVGYFEKVLVSCFSIVYSNSHKRRPMKILVLKEFSLISAKDIVWYYKNITRLLYTIEKQLTKTF